MIYPFIDPVSGRTCELVPGETGAGVRHPDCGCRRARGKRE